MRVSTFVFCSFFFGFLVLIFLGPLWQVLNADSIEERWRWDAWLFLFIHLERVLAARRFMGAAASCACVCVIVKLNRRKKKKRIPQREVVYVLPMDWHSCQTVALNLGLQNLDTHPFRRKDDVYGHQ